MFHRRRRLTLRAAAIGRMTFCVCSTTGTLRSSFTCGIRAISALSSSLCRRRDARLECKGVTSNGWTSSKLLTLT